MELYDAGLDLLTATPRLAWPIHPWTVVGEVTVRSAAAAIADCGRGWQSSVAAEKAAERRAATGGGGR